MSRGLNLAKRPFLNPRPVLRLTVLLWAVGLGVAAFNARLYISHFSGSGESREREETVKTSLEAEQTAVRQLRDELAGYDADWQNEQAVFLNQRIAERSFSWSDLFDRLGEVMPADVRVGTLSPEFGGDRRERSGPQDNEVVLGLRGVSKTPEVLLEFVDALFEHGSFREPNLSSEALQDDGLLDYNLSVIYAARPPEVEETPETPETVADAAGESAAGPDSAADSNADSDSDAEGTVSEDESSATEEVTSE